VSIMHHMWLPYPSPYPWKTIQHSPWAGWTPSRKTESHKQ
jgi:hypothetical protein